MTARERAKLLNNTTLLNFQNRYCKKNGEILWLEWTSIYLPENELVFAIAKDITIHKQKELELRENYTRFRQLATHFKNDIEKDRKQIATNLHEDLAQLATAVKTKIDWLASPSHNLPPLLDKQVRQLLQTTNLLVNNIRKVSYAISPASIADLGLDDAFKSLCKEFSALTGIRCQYKSGFNEEALSYEVKLDIYRVCQEALLNVMQHAEASQVTISVYDNDDGLAVTVTDNGKGFDKHSATLAEGLSTMHGRALSINGSLFVNSNDSGTTVELILTEHR
jgi:signal transduction histidine kinase